MMVTQNPEAITREWINENYDYLSQIAVPVIRNFLGNSSSVEDVLQEALIKTFRFGEDYDPSREFKAWFSTIAANAAKDYRRKREVVGRTYSLDAEVGEKEKRFSEIICVSHDENHLERMAREETNALIRDSVSRLDQKSQTLIRMHYFEGKMYEEIANELDIPVGTVKSRLNKARGDLMKMLSDVHEYA